LRRALQPSVLQTPFEPIGEARAFRFSYAEHAAGRAHWRRGDQMNATGKPAVQGSMRNRRR
jgi:hypothetical protein